MSIINKFQWIVITLIIVVGSLYMVTHTYQYFAAETRAHKAFCQYQLDVTKAEWAWKDVKVFDSNNATYCLAVAASDKARNSRLEWEKYEFEFSH